MNDAMAEIDDLRAQNDAYIADIETKDAIIELEQQTVASLSNIKEQNQKLTAEIAKCREEREALHK